MILAEWGDWTSTGAVAWCAIATLRELIEHLFLIVLCLVIHVIIK